MKRFALVYDGKDEFYEVHRYSLWFRTFGITTFTFIASGATPERAKERAFKKITGKYEVIEIFEFNK